MKAFRFRLESLLHLRSLTRERCLKEYADAINDRRLAVVRSEELAAQLNQIEDRVASLRREGMSGHDQATFLSSIDHAQDMLKQQRKVVEFALTKEEDKRKSYLKADVSEKTMMRLKERRKKDHLLEQATNEERALEDVIGARYNVILPTEISHETA
jgi:flagellar export protein FliJ